MNLVNFTALENSPTIVWVVNNVILPVIIGVAAGCILWILFEKKENRGKAIAEKHGQMLRINDHSYKVNLSQATFFMM
jgi:hypothetical protein